MNRRNDFQRLISSRYGTRRQGGGLTQDLRTMLYQNALAEAAKQGVEQPTAAQLYAILEETPSSSGVGSMLDKADVLFAEVDYAPPMFPDLSDIEDSSDLADLSDLEEESPPPHLGHREKLTAERLLEIEDMASVSDELDFRLSGEEPMERTQTMRALLESRGLQADDLTDDLGRPLGMESLLKIAQISGIWPLLSEEQRRLFMESDGFLRDGKAYISKRIRTEAPLVRRTLVQLANGTRLAL